MTLHWSKFCTTLLTSGLCTNMKMTTIIALLILCLSVAITGFLVEIEAWSGRAPDIKVYLLKLTTTRERNVAFEK
ncbi:hypothetical protein QVD17_09192 [Tagetes erecta]|uniref:Uncharacterized protein n=1 Tax=Tagetes erecta TaxID=13708 RepID=A0AAD8L5J3_TARER|nr:hypothetical protein QVD17_09192 [Tagetes erecta]